MVTCIDGKVYSNMIISGSENLKYYKDLVNDLNVFPIPDGDTGDNMFMTISSGASEVSSNTDRSLSNVAYRVAQSMLLGARGNSGVILSRIFSGIAKGLEGHDKADINVFNNALIRGIEEAYKAVSTPVEGTILTVYKDGVNYASEKLEDYTTPQSYFDDIIKEFNSSLERTPDLLQVLKDAGVVDSGGAGLIYIFEGMLDALNDNIKEYSNSNISEKKNIDINKFTENDALEFGYCTEFLLRLQRSKVDLDNFDISVLTDYYNSIGDSLVIFRDGSIVKVHVHTFKPGDVLNFTQQFGEFLTLKIENMTLQHNETEELKSKSIKKKKVHKRYGLVTVATGKGIIDTFDSLGCDIVIDGGQHMNPSSQQFIDAFNEIDADHIFVFPNNKNIIMAAEQAAEIHGKDKILIVPTKSIGEGYSALSMIDLTVTDPNEIKNDLVELIQNVITGEISLATKDAVVNGFKVEEGKYIGFHCGNVYSCNKIKNESAFELAKELNASNYDVMLAIYGNGTTEEEANELKNKIEKEYRNIECILINGGQPLYDYILVLE